MTRRSLNWPIVVAPLLSVAAFISYLTTFVKWPITRDVPWATFLIFALAALLLVLGMRRALGPGRLRVIRFIGGTVSTVLSVAALVLFLYVRFVAGAELPRSSDAPQVGQRAPEFTLLDEHGRSVSLSSLLTTSMPGTSAPGHPQKAVLLIFYMYSGCRACNSEFHDIQRNLPKLEGLGVRPVAISIDTPDVSRALSEEAAYTFTFLSDPQMDVIRRYAVADQEQGARPAEFLVDAAGIVRWRYLTNNLFVRATADQIIDAAEALR